MIKASFLVPLMTACILVLSGCEKKSELPPEPVEPLTFAVFGNTGMSGDGGAALRVLADSIRSSGADFAVDLGNRLGAGVTSAGIGALWDAVDGDRELFSIPVFAIPGPNDIFDYDSDVEYEARYGSQWYSFRRNGIFFVFLDTEDESYNGGFGTKARIGGSQLRWLETMLDDSRNAPVVVFMHRPIWIDNQVLWNTTVRPLLKSAGVVLMVAASDDGLCDWGDIDGIRAVTTGCTGSVEQAGVGLFPHILTATVGDGDMRFSVYAADTSPHDGIPVDRDAVERVDSLLSAVVPQPVEADAGWNIGESREITLENTFDVQLSGRLEFGLFGGTTWKLDPERIDIAVDPGMKATYRLGIRGTSPDLGPQPDYSVSLSLGGLPVAQDEGTLTVRIPSPRKDTPVVAEAGVAAVLPYNFKGGQLRIPVETEGYDNCGRCIIYRTDESGNPQCVFISPLRDFRPGINEFTWNGSDLEGQRVASDSLTYRVFVYNKKAPATWVAEGPPCLYGSAMMKQSMSGMSFLTHDSHAVTGFRIGVSSGAPRPEVVVDAGAVLGDVAMTGFAYGDNGRLYCSTRYGVVSMLIDGSGVQPDHSFGSEGFAVLPDFRGREIGGIAFASGVVYVGLGGAVGAPPSIVAMDALSGDILDVIGLGEWYGEDEKPPSFAVSPDGFICAHPDGGVVVKTDLFGEALWTSGSDTPTVGTGSDGRSFIYGVGVDPDGFIYVNTPGTSARCVVLGPDGVDLFRVILVSLPGLRVSAVVPSVEGKPGDGLYFVTRGGDRPYVFHVPFTFRKGMIVDESGFAETE